MKMEGSGLDHSDSDSGESWTLLDNSENTSACADDALPFQQIDIDHERNTVVQNNDDDTDGISIISDSDPESTPCDITFDKYLPADETHMQNTYNTANSNPQNYNKHDETLRNEDDLLGDSNGKHRTYVHRRNKRLSTVLNIIMLGSIITAAGVAIGHMWGAKNDCNVHTTPTVNKILSNLYKLQEENAYLRSKLKELTVMTQHKMSAGDKLPVKHTRCKKMYEESLDKMNPEKVTKCVDSESKGFTDMMKSHLIGPEYEKGFINDLDKLKHVYQQNRSWLDSEVAKRMKRESIKKVNHSIRGVNLSPVNEITMESKEKNIKDVGSQSRLFTEITNQVADEESFSKFPAEEKITYADSLKSTQHMKKHRKGDIDDSFMKDYVKRKHKKIPKLPPEVIKSEEEFVKDDRYIAPKIKEHKKKNDQKLHKKQKRRNKYEQWEMIGGIMKDYETFSMTSHEDVIPQVRFDSGYLNYNFVNQNDIGQSATDTLKIKVNDNDPENKPDKHISDDKEGERKVKDASWFEKRAALRTEARRKSELELFGENAPNSGSWYFRRMKRREQCRAKNDNSTYRKQSKRNMNFKMKH